MEAEEKLNGNEKKMADDNLPPHLAATVQYR